jgi:hypothetical protein
MEATDSLCQFEASFAQGRTDGPGRGWVFEAGQVRHGEGGDGAAALVEDWVRYVDDSANLVAVAFFVSLLADFFEVLL